MRSFSMVNPSDFGGEFTKMFGTQWALVTAEKDGKVNTMTIGWGEIGCLFGKAVATVYIRPSRFTYDMIDSSGKFSIAFFSPEYKQKLGYCGKTSGRDEDKIAKCGFTVAHHEGIPYIEEADTVVICKTIYKQDLKPECFEPDSKSAIIDRFFPEGDFHRIYTAEIEAVLQK